MNHVWLTPRQSLCEAEKTATGGSGDRARTTTRSTPLRAIIQATALDGLTVREAALLLGVAEGTARTRLMRARARLRELLRLARPHLAGGRRHDRPRPAGACGVASAPGGPA